MFNWLSVKKKECHMCGEDGILTYYEEWTTWTEYGKICQRCIKYLEAKVRPEKERRLKKAHEERLKRQKAWRKQRDKNV